MHSFCCEQDLPPTFHFSCELRNEVLSVLLLPFAQCNTLPFLLNSAEVRVCKETVTAID